MRLSGILYEIEEKIDDFFNRGKAELRSKRCPTLPAEKYIMCSCCSLEHLLRLSYSLDDPEMDVYLSIHLAGIHKNIFRRIWIAVKYIFGRGGHVDSAWDEYLLDEPKVREFAEYLQEALEWQESYWTQEGGQEGWGIGGE